VTRPAEIDVPPAAGAVTRSKPFRQDPAVRLERFELAGADPLHEPFVDASRGLRISMFEVQLPEALPTQRAGDALTVSSPAWTS